MTAVEFDLVKEMLVSQEL